MGKNVKGKKSLMTCAIACAGFYAALAPALGQDAASGGIEEVVVTAQKRADTLQNIPMSITAFTSSDLQRAGIADFQDYAVQVPNLSFAYTNSLSAGAQSVALRGVFGNGTTGMYLDDTPLPESVDPDALDLERIEVLRGPQGTLYGARSMGGTIRLITKLPDPSVLAGDLHSFVSATKNGGTNADIDGSLNVPLIDNVLAIRANGYYRTISGIFDRVASPDAPVDFGTHKNVDGSRYSGGQVAASLFLLNGDLEITPRFAYETTKENGRHLADYRAGNFVQYRLFDQDEVGGEAWRLYTLTAKYSTSFGEFTSATSGFNRHIYDSEDFSELAELLIGPVPVPALIKAHTRANSFAQELRFTSSFSGPFQITTGIFYQNQSNILDFPPTPVSPYSSNIFSQHLNTGVDEFAVYGEANYDITPSLQLIFGARWFDNTVHFTGNQDGDLVFPDTFNGVQKERGVNPKVGLQYKLTDTSKIYATAAKGFRIGGVNSYSNLLCAGDLSTLGLSTSEAKTFNSDSLWSYELGAKTSWFGNRLAANGSLFDIEWSNIQQNVALPTCGFFLTLNAGSAYSRGFEFELTAAPTDSLTINVGTGYTDAVITSSGAISTIVPGTPVQQVPKWTVTASADYNFAIADLPSFLHVDDSFVDSSISENNGAARFRPSYNLVNLRLGANVGPWQFAVFVKNVFDKAANLSDVPPLAIEYPGRPRIATNRPRTIGLDGRVSF